MKIEVEVKGVDAPVEEVENAIYNVLYNQLDNEVEADYHSFDVKVNGVGEKMGGSRMPHMWAIDFRNMNTAMHGLFYGKDFRTVNQFYKELQSLDIDDVGYELDLMGIIDGFEGDIEIIDEINYREIRKLPSGKYGIEIDDVEYWIINNLSEDLYMESKQKGKMNKIMKESDETDDVTPRIYVGTYAKYNNGSLGGQWVDLIDFGNYKEFVDYCKEIHSDEKNPEFMVQDYEGYPSSLYHEGGLPTEEEFDKIIEISELDGDEKKAYAAFLNLGWSNDSIDAFRDAYFGKYTDDNDLGYECVEMGGMPQNSDYYFDFDAFGRDLMYDYHMGDEDNEDAEGNPEDPDHYYDNEGYDQGEYKSDRQVGEDFVEEAYGSVEEMSKDTLERYFDYAQFGKEVRLNDLTEEDGYLFWNR